MPIRFSERAVSLFSAVRNQLFPPTEATTATAPVRDGDGVTPTSRARLGSPALDSFTPYLAAHWRRSWITQQVCSFIPTLLTLLVYTTARIPQQFVYPIYQFGYAFSLFRSQSLHLLLNHYHYHHLCSSATESLWW